MSTEHIKQNDSAPDRYPVAIDSYDLKNIITAVKKVAASSQRSTTNGGRTISILAPFDNTWIDTEQLPLFGGNYDKHDLTVNETRNVLICISSGLKRSSNTNPWHGAHTIIDYGLSDEESHVIPDNDEGVNDSGISSREMMKPVATITAYKYLNDCTAESIEDIAWNDSVYGVINRIITNGYPVIIQKVTHTSHARMNCELFYKGEKIEATITFVAEVVSGVFIEMRARFDFILNIVEDVSVEAWIDREQYTTETPISTVRIGEFIGEKIAEMGY